MKLFSVSVGLILVVVLIVVGLVYFQSQTPTKLIRLYREPATNLSKPGLYMNSEYGFQIPYPVSSEAYASCDGLQKAKTSQVPVEVLDDKNNKTVYFANSKTVYILNKQYPDASYNFDYETCKMVPTTVKLIT